MFRDYWNGIFVGQIIFLALDWQLWSVWRQMHVYCVNVKTQSAC